MYLKKYLFLSRVPYYVHNLTILALHTQFIRPVVQPYKHILTKPGTLIILLLV